MLRKVILSESLFQLMVHVELWVLLPLPPYFHPAPHPKKMKPQHERNAGVFRPCRREITTEIQVSNDSSFFREFCSTIPLAKVYMQKSPQLSDHTKSSLFPSPKKSMSEFCLFFKVLQKFLQSISDSQKSIADPGKLKVPNPIRRLRWGVDQGQHAISTGANEREHPEDSEPKLP